MRSAVGAEQAGLGQGARVPAVGLHLAGARRVHRGEVWIGDDDLVPQRLETPRYPFTVGRGLDHDPRPAPTGHRCEPLGLGSDPSLDQLAPLGRHHAVTPFRRHTIHDPRCSRPRPGTPPTMAIRSPISADGTVIIKTTTSSRHTLQRSRTTNPSKPRAIRALKPCSASSRVA